MAISGKFEADFSAFKTAVEQAEVTLRGFETSSAKVESQLSRMTNSFMGTQVIQQATLMTEAVERAGGASVLTAKEMAAVNAQVTEAIAKFTALGEEAPQAMLDLQKATASVETTTGGLSTKMVAMGTFIGEMAANAVTALTRLAVEGIGKLVSSLDDFLLRGSEVGDIEENFMKLAAAAGHSGDVLLGVLAEGTHRTVENLELMKLVNRDLAAGMNLTADQFRTMAQGAFALAQATGGDVTAALGAMNDAMLTGRTRAVEMLTGKIDLKAAEDEYAASLGTTADKLEQDEKIQAARIAILDSVTEATARLGEQTDGLDERVAQAGVTWQNFSDQLGKAVANSPVVTAALDSIAGALQQAFGVNQEELIANIVAGVNQLAITAVDAGLVLIEWGRTGASVFAALSVPQKALTDSFVFMIERFAAGIATIAELAAKLPGVGDAFDKVATATRQAATFWAGVREEADKSLQSAIAAAAGHSKFDDTMAKLSATLVTVKAAMVEASLETERNTEVVTAWQGPIDTSAASIRRATTASEEFWKSVAKWEDNARWLPPFTGLLDDVDRSLAKLDTTTGKSVATFRTMTEAITGEAVPALDALDSQINRVSMSWSEAMAAVGRGEGTMTGTVGGTGTFDKERRDQTLKAWEERRYYGPVVGGSRENPWGSGPDWAALETLWGVHRQAGGPVTAGAPYVVGEGGPELFVPNANGMIQPNAGGSITVNISTVMGNAQEIARLVSAALVDAARGRGDRMPVRT